jgi:uncharacterized repeat protein (TIGR01451 family)
VNTPVPGRVALDIAKRSLVSGAIRVGDLITYQLVITNIGSVIAPGVVLTDALPDGTQFVAASSAPVVAVVNGPPTVWTVGNLNPGSVFVATYIVRVTSTVGRGAIINQAQMSYRDGGTNTTIELSSNLVRNPFQPTSITLADFGAAADAGGGVRVNWRSTSEQNTLGFRLLRSHDSSLASAVVVNSDLVIARGGASGASYDLVDANGLPGDAYWLQEVELDGTVLVYGPVLVGRPAAQPQTPQNEVAPLLVAVLTPEASVQPAPVAVPTQAPAHVALPQVPVAPAPIAPVAPVVPVQPEPVVPLQPQPAEPAPVQQSPAQPAAELAATEAPAPVREASPVRIEASATPVRTVAEVAAVPADQMRSPAAVEPADDASPLRTMSTLALLGAMLLGVVAFGAVGAVGAIAATRMRRRRDR